MHYNILVCGVLIRMASIVDSVILGLWIKCKLSMYRHDINLLQPAGYVMHQQFNIQQLYAPPTLYVMCFVFI